MSKNYTQKPPSPKIFRLIGRAALAAVLAAAGSAAAQSAPFDRLYGNADQYNYYLGHYPVTGSDGLDIHWYGGVRIGTAQGTAIQVAGTDVGIGIATPQAKLDVAGGINLANSFPYSSTVRIATKV